MPGPLSHVRVLDLSRIMAGPWATQILADLGADVIKIERTGVGDDTRQWGPPWLTGNDRQPTQESGYFLSVNRGKRSIEVDLSSAEGQEVIREIARSSDIVVENFKTGTLGKFGLGYEHLKLVNPSIIYASITGFGKTGPRKDEAAYDFMIQAMGGLMSITGAPDGVPGGGPQKVGVPIIDLMTGMYTAVAVLAALANREVTGEGEYIDMAMLDVSAAMLANQAMNHLVSGRVPQRQGNKHPNIQPQDVFATADGHIVIAVGNDDQFRRFAVALEMSEWADDERFFTNEARIQHLDLLHPMITERLSAKSLSHWLAALGEAKVPSGPINTVPMVFAEEQIKHRKILRQLKNPMADDVPQVVSPMVFENAPLEFDRAPPLLGEHTEEILTELGLNKKGGQ